MRGYDYVPEVENFFAIVSEWADRDYAAKNPQEKLAALRRGENLSVSDLQVLLTSLLRSERFCDGAWLDAFQNGTVLAILRALASTDQHHT